MIAGTIKQKAKELIERLPDDITWEDLQYKIYVCEAIEAGLAESDAGLGQSVEEVRKLFGLPQ